MTITVLVIALVIVIILISLYNNLIKLRNNRENAFANIDTQLQQRYDLIPQLVSTVKGYASHERETLEKVTVARANAMRASTINDKVLADNEVSRALAGLRVVRESYPDLKASANFLQLQSEMSDIENKIAAARRFFNSSTREFNNAVQTFPSNIIARLFNFHIEPMFEISQQERDIITKAPEIKF